MTDDQKRHAPEPYMGTYHDASVDGFRKLLDNVRDAARKGHELVAIVPLQKDGKIGSIYRNTTWRPARAPLPEDDREPAPFFDPSEHGASLPHEDEDGL